MVEKPCSCTAARLLAGVVLLKCTSIKKFSIPNNLSTAQHDLSSDHLQSLQQLGTLSMQDYWSPQGYLVETWPSSADTTNSVAEDIFPRVCRLAAANRLRVGSDPAQLAKFLSGSSMLSLRVYMIGEGSTFESQCCSEGLECQAGQIDQLLREACAQTSTCARKDLLEYKSKNNRFSKEIVADLKSVLPLLRVDPFALTGERVFPPRLDFCCDSNEYGTSLSSIYQRLPSPMLDTSAVGPPSWKQIIIEATDDNPNGLCTELFAYQRSTVCAMLRNESLVTSEIPDPYYIPIRCCCPTPSRSGSTMYLDPADFSVRRRAPMVPGIRGGILAEEMGTGKTIECLALILHTKNTLPSRQSLQPSGQLGEPLPSGFTSQLAMDTFNQSHYSGADPALDFAAPELLQLPYYHDVMDSGVIEDLAIPSFDDTEFRQERQETAHRLPRLTDLCAHSIRTSETPVPWLQALPSLPPHLAILVSSAATPFFKLWPPIQKRAYRGDQPRVPIQVYLSPATVVCVPSTLVQQWTEQIARHTHPGALRTLVLQHDADPIPDARELAEKYDLILLSHSRFGRENDRDRLQRFVSTIPRKCECPYIGRSRTVDCRCPPPPTQASLSPLLQCFFKRLIVDEGNVMSGSSQLVELANCLQVECRWIVSGTPTESLVGDYALQTALTTAMDSKEDSQDSGYHESKATASGVATLPPPSEIRPWSQAEARDLNRLRGLIVDFLRCSPFHAPDGSEAPRSWDRDVVAPLLRCGMKKTGSDDAPAFGAVGRITSILRRVMIRNQAAVVESEKPLPPLTYHIARLHFTRGERLTYNCLQALILLNAVTSQRTDSDYFFHISQLKHLQAIMENLALACFHFAVPELKSLVSKAAILAAEDMQKTKWTENEKVELRAARDRLQEALDDPAWCAVLDVGEVSYNVSFLPKSIGQQWSWKILDYRRFTTDEISAVSNAARTLVAAQGLNVVDDDLVEDLITEGAKSWQQRVEKESALAAKAKRKKNEQDLARLGGAPGHSSSSTAFTTTSKARPALQGNNIHQKKRASVPHTSALAPAVLDATSSTKLSFVLQGILAIPRDEKCIVFSALDNVLHELSCVLDVLQIGHRIYASGVRQEKRDKFVADFNRTDAEGAGDRDLVRVLLMKVGVGAYGLDLHIASHVYFLEPVLDRALESQALKRAYRLGQVRPVKVTVLAMSGTFEEIVLKRRKTMDEMERAVAEGVSLLEGSETRPGEDESSGRVKSAARDEGLRSFVSHPQFIEAAKNELSAVLLADGTPSHLYRLVPCSPTSIFGVDASKIPTPKTDAVTDNEMPPIPRYNQPTGKGQEPRPLSHRPRWRPVVEIPLRQPRNSVSAVHPVREQAGRRPSTPPKSTTDSGPTSSRSLLPPSPLGSTRVTAFPTTPSPMRGVTPSSATPMLVSSSTVSTGLSSPTSPTPWRPTRTSNLFISIPARQDDPPKDRITKGQSGCLDNPQSPTQPHPAKRRKTVTFA